MTDVTRLQSGGYKAIGCGARILGFLALALLLPALATIAGNAAILAIQSPAFQIVALVGALTALLARRARGAARRGTDCAQ